jgi:threonine dehydratase
MNAAPPLTLPEIRAARARLGDRIVDTPVALWDGPHVTDRFREGTRVFLKLELFQRTGSFKPRGALLNMLELSSDALARGVCAMSAGNHAIATAYAARALGTTAKVVMIKTANPFRVEMARRYGAEIELAEDVHRGFERVEEIARDEGRAFIHPFEGRTTALGTATLGLEMCEQTGELDVVIIPIGGGGLAAGVASAVKLLYPRCHVVGVEPEGADSMHRSFAAGEPRSIERVATIADSLGAPYARPISFELCLRNIDELVRVNDDELRAAMRVLLETAKLAVEPAGASATAALLGPLRERAQGKRVAVVVCGANIDAAGFAKLIAS